MCDATFLCNFLVAISITLVPIVSIGLWACVTRSSLCWKDQGTQESQETQEQENQESQERQENPTIVLVYPITIVVENNYPFKQ